MPRLSEDAARPCLTFRPAAGQTVADVLDHREMGKQGKVLEHQPDTTRLGRRLPMLAGRRNGLPPDGDAPCLQPFEPRCKPQQRALAAAGGAEQADGLARPNREIHRVDGEDGAVPVRYAFECQARHGPMRRRPIALSRGRAGNG